MNFDPVLLASRMQPMKAQGLGRDETINLFFQRALAQCPHKPAIVSYRAGLDAPIRLSYRELGAQVERIARGLIALGVGRSDVVTWQLPNCWEFVALALACARIGAAANPVMPIFRQHELNFMLNMGESKVFIVPKSFRNFDYEAMARGMLPNLPHLKQLVVVGGDDIVLAASPMAHLTGYGFLAMLPINLNSTITMLDVWEPKRALQIIRDEGVTFSMSAATFVADMCQEVEAGVPVSPRFTKYSCAGAPIPPAIVERAYALMGLRISSAWGMTEMGAVTVTEPSRALEKTPVSDGRPLAGVELKVVDANGASLPTGEAGELLVRAPSLFAG